MRGDGNASLTAVTFRVDTPRAPRVLVDRLPGSRHAEDWGAIMSSVFRLTDGPVVDGERRGPPSSVPPSLCGQHAVQFYDDERYLFGVVGEFVREGLQIGNAVVVIATPPHREGIAARLDMGEADDAQRSGRLVWLDAECTLASFMVGDAPDRDRFRESVERVLGAAEELTVHPRAVRAYGEMVDVLWRRGNMKAAIRLEELWTEIVRERGSSLLCAYRMRSFYREGDDSRFLDICKTHNLVLPTESFSRLDGPEAKAREIAFLQQRARALEVEIERRRELEAALRQVLEQRVHDAEELATALRREREARAQAEANDAFKETFLAILGHDLRNPLNTVLTTARLMVRRGEVPLDSQKRLERVVASGIRMERMIDQLLDLTRVRLMTGIPLTLARRDLVPLVSQMVEEIRTAHPARSVDLRTPPACEALVDGDRVEQVVSNLVGNAVAHGDPARPITVTVLAQDAEAVVRVHNFGAPIDPAFLPLLFDPFKREKPQARSEGLGLGLFISDRIVAAHGGRISVESSAEAGTCFEVVLPRGG